MAISRTVLAALAALTLGVQGCSTPTAAHRRALQPSFDQAAPTVTTESWASVMPLPGIEHDTLAYARRDVALGLPPPGYARTAGAWQGDRRPSIGRYFFVPLSRSPRTFLFFDAPAQHERRAPRVPPGAHPWRTAW